MATQICYGFDAGTKEYSGTGTAYESPLEPGVYLLPANSTYTAPPDAVSGYARVWNNSAWVQTEDHRGITIWRDWQTSKVLTDLGPIPEGWSAVKPIAAQDYDAAMEAHLDAELVARGYTKRSPIEYKDSTNARFAQDAADWNAHLTAVMNYGLEIENKYDAGEAVPTLDEFKAALPRIQWTVTL